MTAERARYAGERVNVSGWLVVVLVALAAELAIPGLNLEDTVARPSQALTTLVSELRAGPLRDEIGATLTRISRDSRSRSWSGRCRRRHRELADAARARRGSSSSCGPSPRSRSSRSRRTPWGSTRQMRRFLVAYAAVWPILFNTLYGVRGVDRMLHDVARTSGASRRRGGSSE